jgi:hypothetical protein
MGWLNQQEYVWILWGPVVQIVLFSQLFSREALFQQVGLIPLLGYLKNKEVELFYVFIPSRPIDVTMKGNILSTMFFYFFKSSLIMEGVEK